MNPSRLGRYVSWIVVLLILAGGWAALRLTQRQLQRLVSERETAAPAAPAAPRAIPRSVGPFAAESGPVGRPEPAPGPSGATGAQDEAGTPVTESDARPAPPGAIR